MTDPLASVRHLPVPDQIKYGAARYAHLHRGEECPRKFGGDTVTWAQWFGLVFKQSLQDYIAERRMAA